MDFNIDDIEINSFMNFPYKDNVNVYSDLMIQYGFIILFAVACPLASLIAITMNIIEIFLRLYSYLHIYSRPLGKRAKNIGPWMGIAQFISLLAVITNLMLLYLKSTKTEDKVNEWLIEKYEKTSKF